MELIKELRFQHLGNEYRVRAYRVNDNDVSLLYANTNGEEVVFRLPGFGDVTLGDYIPFQIRMKAFRDGGDSAVDMGMQSAVEEFKRRYAHEVLN